LDPADRRSTAIVRVERGCLDKDILSAGISQEFLACGKEVLLKGFDIERETPGNLGLVLVYGCVPEIQRVGKVQACTNEDSDDENEDLHLRCVIHLIHTP
jgi:hypothetical protein